MGQLRLSDVISALDARYPQESAAAWDHVGLVTGIVDSPVTKALFTVDVTIEIVEEAINMGASLIVAHHPLLFKPLDSVANTDSGRVLVELIKNDIALFTAHTNADVAWPGVSDAIADAFGVKVDENVTLTADGVGRIGSIAPHRLSEFSQKIFSVLPKTSSGIRVAGDVTSEITRVAICGGAGDSLLDSVAKTDADVYITSDLRHHVAQDFVRTTQKALIDISHWASESLWLEPAAMLLKKDIAECGGNLEVEVSQICTDPWQLTHN
jgi:dinuclear metal center YbgI/SA1388 family protein